MKIVFVRHAETDYPKEKKPGEFPGAPLTDNGMVQAIRLAKKLNKFSFDKIYCSDMRRTRQTIAPFAEGCELKINYEPRIREISGKVNGRYDNNWFEESTALQTKRIESFIKTLKRLSFDSLMVLCHYEVIIYLTSKLTGNKVEPEYASITKIKI